MSAEPILTARGLVKRYGRVTALDHADFELYPNEILGVIGDNGAGKSSLIKALCGAVTPDEGEITLEGRTVHFKSPIDGRNAGIETVYQNLALSPALTIAENIFLGREERAPGFLGQWFRLLDNNRMQQFARAKLTELGLMTIQNINQPVETLSGGQRQGVAVARAAAFGSKVIIMDEPTAALGVKESRRVLELIRDVKKRGLPIVLISHNMPHVFEVCDRVHIHRLGRRHAIIDPEEDIKFGRRRHHDRRHGPAALRHALAAAGCSGVTRLTMLWVAHLCGHDGICYGPRRIPSWPQRWATHSNHELAWRSAYTASHGPGTATERRVALSWTTSRTTSHASRTSRPRSGSTP